ncbi:DNA replication/repair protein RecF [Lapidilactobacillus mulanensis]|uniref:DNA replication and repair protein RecF n=1 Tax=Lapidilactobacillus mulanensis TaxID=2485999 RepID=A0ABW4DPJ5_9LACO|nr:DNA replication/repair protein RecF [Lapidilactobacillus mulanensis]
MYLEHLELAHFRNYDALTVDFSPQINVLIGENAQGKTNLLEAVYVLSLARSHRTNDDKSLIQWGHDFAKLSGVVQRQVGRLPLEIVLSHQGKRAKVNHLEQRRLSQYIGQFNVILFAPEDLGLVKGSPAGRRRFIDMEFGQINHQYLYNITQYRAILKQRNLYLRSLQHGQAKDLIYLEVLSDQLAGFGAEIIWARREFLKQMETFASKQHQEITQQRETLAFDYQTVLPVAEIESSEQLYQFLKVQYQKAQKRELQQGTTVLGPHRDDVAFIVNDKNVQTFGSQGQQRTVALSLKLAEIELMRKQTGEAPVLLLDDVLSELDEIRQTHLLKTIQHQVQTFLTTTSLDGVAKEIIGEPTTFVVNDGEIKQQGSH